MHNILTTTACRTSPLRRRWWKHAECGKYMPYPRILEASCIPSAQSMLEGMCGNINIELVTPELRIDCVPRIMWTRLNGKDLLENIWRLNHFVAGLSHESRKIKAQSKNIRTLFAKSCKHGPKSSQ